LVFDAAEWTVFFDDLTKPDRTVHREIVEGYDQADPGDLRESDGFVAALGGTEIGSGPRTSTRSLPVMRMTWRPTSSTSTGLPLSSPT
jgi:hypothetical protein